MKGAPRKLRKSCSLPTCSKTPGECMHCTCDGRCGQHEGGHCGVRREGNGKSCKRDGCARDESCLHSTRATCCHCRNLVSSSNRSSRKRTRADVDDLASAAMATSTSTAAGVEPLDGGLLTKDHHAEDGDDDDDDDDGACSPTSCDGLLPLSTDIFADFELCDDLLIVIKKPRTDDGAVPTTASDAVDVTPAASAAAQDDALLLLDAATPDVLPKSLCEYAPYAARRGLCNLVVVVEGTQFNLHKHPMLLESQLLNAKARESVLTTRSAVPCVQLAAFPGGAEAFEQLCVYAYAGELAFSARTIAALYCAIHYMNMGLDATTQARRFLNTVTQKGASVAALLRVTRDASLLMDKHDSLSVCAELHLECVDALARELPLQLAAVSQILQFPIELFLQVTQEMLATRGSAQLANDAVNQLCVQAQLAQLHRDSMDKINAEAPQRCLELLQQSLAPSSSSAAKPEASRTAAASTVEEDDALFMKMMCDFEMDPTSDDESSSGDAVGGASGSGSYVEALSAASLEPFAFGRSVFSEPFAV